MTTKIEWTDESWNPVAGCSKVSDGCKNCYALRMAYRQAAMGNENYRNVLKQKGIYPAAWNGKTVCIESKLTEPLHWRKPRKIFVCSMSDLFHESVPFDFIDRIMAAMVLCPQHTFQILTKRPERMLEFFSFTGRIKEWEWPLPNVWLGVTAENQEMADKRIPLLLQTPAAKRFVSIEPMLGAIQMSYDVDDGYSQPWSWLSDDWGNKDTLDLVICGGESGTGARPMHPDWARSLRDQCEAAGVPFFFKQWGKYRHGRSWTKDGKIVWMEYAHTCRKEIITPWPYPLQKFQAIHITDFGNVSQMLHFACTDAWMSPVGKKKAGHLLDGKKHRPEW